MSQLILDLGHRPALGAADFLVAPCNEGAVGWLDRWPVWPAPVLALHGPEGCGKSHLVAVWCERSGADVVAGRELGEWMLPGLASERPCVAVEDADRGVAEPVLFHLVNIVAARQGSLLLTGRTAPSRWPLALADLRSRLAAAFPVPVLPPDDRLLAGLLAKLFADRQVRVAEDVIAYLLLRMERSFAAARALVDALDRAALAERRPVTVPLARQVLDAQGSPAAAQDEVAPPPDLFAGPRPA